MKKYEIICIIDSSCNQNESLSKIMELTNLSLGSVFHQDCTVLNSNKRLKTVLNDYISSRLGDAKEEHHVFVLVFCDDIFLGTFKLWREIKIKDKFKIVIQCHTI